MDQLKNLENLAPEVQKHVGSYLRKLLLIAGEDILSVLVFGSATGPDYVPGRSNVNVAIVVREIDADFLKKCLKPIEEGFKKRIVAPLLLTPEYIESSLDVFPIEFLDMRETGLVIVGSDPLAHVNLAGAKLRLECEQKLKGTLLRIRQAYLEHGLAHGGVEKVLSESLNSLVPVFRAMILLKGGRPPRSKLEIVNSVCQTFGVSPQVFLQILTLKMEMKRVPRESEEKILSDYMKSIEELAKIVDGLEIQ